MCPHGGKAQRGRVGSAYEKPGDSAISYEEENKPNQPGCGSTQSLVHARRVLHHQAAQVGGKSVLRRSEPSPSPWGLVTSCLSLFSKSGSVDLTKRMTQGLKKRQQMGSPSSPLAKDRSQLARSPARRCHSEPVTRKDLNQGGPHLGPKVHLLKSTTYIF